MGSENRSWISTWGRTRVVLSAGTVSRTRGGTVSIGPPDGGSGFAQPPRNAAAASATAKPRTPSPTASGPSGRPDRGARALPALPRTRFQATRRALRPPLGDTPSLPHEEIVENRLLQMHPILCLRKDDRPRSLHHVL